MSTSLLARVAIAFALVGVLCLLALPSQGLFVVASGAVALFEAVMLCVPDDCLPKW
jgi:hypothetical protein